MAVVFGVVLGLAIGLAIGFFAGMTFLIWSLITKEIRVIEDANGVICLKRSADDSKLT